MSRELSRRRFLVWAGSAMAATLVAACQPKVVEKIVKETVVVAGTPQVVEKEVTKVVKETVEVEKVVAAAPAEELKGKIRVDMPFFPGLITGDFPEGLEEGFKLRDEYQELNPDVEVEFLKVQAPEGTRDTRAWLNTQIVAGLAPDMFNISYYHAQFDYAKGWYTPLDYFLDKPNRYVPGNTRWKDLYSEETWVRRAPDGQNYFLPPALGGANIGFANMDIMDKAGVEIPTTWTEMFATCKALKDKGFVPYSTWGESWYWEITIDQLIHDAMYNEIDSLEPDGFLGVKECTRAVKLGIFKADSYNWRTAWKLVQEFSHYWQKDFMNALNLSQESQMLFRAGECAMTGAWAGFIQELEADEGRDFEYQTFAFPKLTKAYVPEAVEDPKYISGRRPLSGGTCIQVSARKNGVLDECVDFLMWWYAPDNLARLIKEASKYEGFTYVPSPKELEAVNVPKAALVGIPRRFFMDYVGVRYFYPWWDLIQLVWAGKVSLEEAIEKDQEYLMTAADEAIEEFHWETEAEAWTA